MLHSIIQDLAKLYSHNAINMKNVNAVHLDTYETKVKALLYVNFLRKNKTEQSANLMLKCLIFT